MLLTDITGSFRPGVLTALMGVSGAGKVRGVLTALMGVSGAGKVRGVLTALMGVSGAGKVREGCRGE